MNFKSIISNNCLTAVIILPLFTIIFFSNPCISQTYAIPINSVVNGKAKASHESELTTQILLGFPLKVLQKQNEWSYCQTLDGFKAWFQNLQLQLISKTEYDEYLSKQKIIITKLWGNVFSHASDSSAIVSDFVLGDIFETDKQDNGFFHILFLDGREGYIRCIDANFFDSWLKNLTFSHYSIIQSAHQFMGLPYLWGGSSSKSLDCSGYVQLLYLINGFIFPRDAIKQMAIGKEIPIKSDYSNLLPGDLLFFGVTKNQQERIYHVGMYLGNLEFIHASGMVKISSLDCTQTNYIPKLKSDLLHASRVNLHFLPKIEDCIKNF